MVRFLVENIIMKSPVWYILIMSSDLQKWKLEGCLILHGGLVSKWERSKGTGIERAGNIKAPTRARICARGDRVVEKTVWRERDGEKVFSAEKVGETERRWGRRQERGTKRKSCLKSHRLSTTMVTMVMTIVLWTDGDDIKKMTFLLWYINKPSSCQQCPMFRF